MEKVIYYQHDEHRQKILLRNGLPPRVLPTFWSLRKFVHIKIHNPTSLMHAHFPWFISYICCSKDLIVERNKVLCISIHKQEHEHILVKLIQFNSIQRLYQTKKFRIESTIQSPILYMKIKLSTKACESTLLRLFR